jgi:hypothetical protein
MAQPPLPGFEKLSPTRYHEPAFKNWFAGSVVRHAGGKPRDVHGDVHGSQAAVYHPEEIAGGGGGDHRISDYKREDPAHGTPSVVYHGTTGGKFDQFDPGKDGGMNLFGKGFYFTENPQIAHEYADKPIGRQKINEKTPVTREMFDAFHKKLKEGQKGATTTRYMGLAGLMNAIKTPEQMQRTFGTQMFSKRQFEEDYPEHAHHASTAAEVHFMSATADRFYPGGVSGWGDKKSDSRHVIKAHLAIRNPFDMDRPIKHEHKERLAATLKKHGMGMRLEHGMIPLHENARGQHFYDAVTDAVAVNAPPKIGADPVTPAKRKAEHKSKVNEILGEAGFDGITHIGGGRMRRDGPRHRVWIAFHPSQVKHVDNEGSWSPEEPNMYKAIPLSKARAVASSRHWSELSPSERDAAYDMFKQSYDAATGESWERPHFDRRAANWTMWGDGKGFVATRYQRRARMHKIVGAAGNNGSKHAAMKALLATGEPVWSAATPDIVAGMTKHYGMKAVAPEHVKQFGPHLAASGVLGGATLHHVDDDGTMHLSYPNLSHVAKKQIVGNDAYHASLDQLGQAQGLRKAHGDDLHETTVDLRKVLEHVADHHQFSAWVHPDGGIRLVRSHNRYAEASGFPKRNEYQHASGKMSLHNDIGVAALAHSKRLTPQQAKIGRYFLEMAKDGGAHTVADFQEKPGSRVHTIHNAHEIPSHWVENVSDLKKGASGTFNKQTGRMEWTGEGNALSDPSNKLRGNALDGLRLLVSKPSSALRAPTSQRTAMLTAPHEAMAATGLTHVQSLLGGTDKGFGMSHTFGAANSEEGAHALMARLQHGGWGIHDSANPLKEMGSGSAKYHAFKAGKDGQVHQFLIQNRGVGGDSDLPARQAGARDADMPKSVGQQVRQVASTAATAVRTMPIPRSAGSGTKGSAPTSAQSSPRQRFIATPGGNADARKAAARAASMQAAASNTTAIQPQQIGASQTSWGKGAIEQQGARHLQTVTRGNNFHHSMVHREPKASLLRLREHLPSGFRVSRISERHVWINGVRANEYRFHAKNPQTGETHHFYSVRSY